MKFWVKTHKTNLNMLRTYLISEYAFTIEWPNIISEETTKAIARAEKYLEAHPFAGYIECVPAYVTLTIFFDTKKISTPIKELSQKITETIAQLGESHEDTDVAIRQIPICIDTKLAPDLEYVLHQKGLTLFDFTDLIMSSVFTVNMIGFLPGFPYMSGLPNKLHTPRKATPSLQIESGSVAIGGQQLGIYPVHSPGGWHVIGKTPLSLFSLANNPSFLLSASQKVQFYNISKGDYYHMKEDTDIISMLWPDTKYPSIVVTKSIGIVSIQAEPRMHYRKYGIPLSGAMDIISQEYANKLVGNKPYAPIIEILMGQCSFIVKTPIKIVITGAAHVWVNGSKYEKDTIIVLNQNDLVEIKYNGKGMVAYCAILGQIEVPHVIGSQSTCLSAKLGYILSKGAQVTINPQKPESHINFPKIEKKQIICIYPGPEYHLLSHDAQSQLISEAFKISPQSNRMGIRLEGPKLELQIKKEMLSTAVTIGAIQLTPDGQLIILMQDSQTIGGYPRVAQVSEMNLPYLSRLSLGEKIGFFINRSYNY